MTHGLIRGRVALVTGASRGVGKGIAVALGAAGATVYVTGRSVRAEPSTTGLGGTIEETADAVSATGGVGVPVRCDHRDDREAQAVFERIEGDHGKLDILVNSAWGGYELLHRGEYQRFVAAFWEQPIELWDSMFGAGVRAAYVASVHAARLMVPRRSGLIVNVSFVAGRRYQQNVAYGVSKAATDRLTADTALELREHGVAVVSLYPGLVRTEGVMRWAEFLDLSDSESAEFVGRSVVALAVDPEVLERTGEVVVAAELAAEYGLADGEDSPVSVGPRARRAP